MKKLVFILSLSLSFHLCFSQVTKSAAPSWVDISNYEEVLINNDDVSQGTALLLFDQQIHQPKKTVYYRFASKIVDNVGIQNSSTIDVSYDPSYQKLQFHRLNIIRDGEVIDKLKVKNFQLIQRELNADSYLYDGSLSAMLNISDVRTGDIIDYAYSIIGFNPIHGSKFSTSFYLNDYDPIGKLNISILSDRSLNFKSFNSTLEPAISKESGLTKYLWEDKEVEKADIENNVPYWKMNYASVLVSDYESWEEVVNWATPIFEVNERPSKQLQDKIDEINSTYKTEGEKIEATLNFVQDEVRYLGLEQGIGAYKPFMPNKVFEQRFGDCKDKSLLMTTMLNHMDIEAYPMLVNTYLKHTIKEFIPSPKFFDHCVVKVVTDFNRELWYDPTISNQGGSYKNTYFPNYEYGLVLKPGNFEFDYIQSTADNKVETLEEYTLEEIGKGATLQVTTTYYEYEADNIRSYFKNNSLSSITKDYENFYSNYFYNISAVGSPRTEDNIKENAFTVYEEYAIDSLWEPMSDKPGFISVSFTPSSLSGLLHVPTKKERKSELAIAYPTTKQHDIKVILPTAWNISEDTQIVNSSGFYYDYQVNYDNRKKVLEINHLLKTQKNHITQDEFEAYTKDVNKIDESFGYMLYISDDSAGVSSGTFGEDDAAVQLVEAFFNVGIWIFLACGLFVFIYLRNEKKNKPKNL